MSTGGLRERKKQRTRESIQDHALRLYQEQGYAETTVEQIAEAAEVSPSTFFRYFPTKTETVLYDRMDPIFAELLVAQSAELSPIAATRAAIRQAWESQDDGQLALEETRMQLLANVPELRAAAAQQVESTIPIFLDAIAQRVGREPDDEVVASWIGAVAGVVLAGMYRALSEGEDVIESVDRALEHLEAGLPL